MERQALSDRPERVVHFRVRTILSLLGIVIAVALLLEVVWIARHVISWILISVFLALALDPAVQWLQRHGLRRRGLAAGTTYLLALLAVVVIGALFVPTLVRQTNDFVRKLATYVGDVTKGKGRLGFLERKYHVKEKVEKAVRRTVQLSPLLVLIAVLIGAELSGILGALAAIPVAGSIQVVIVDYLRQRRQQIADLSAPPPGGHESPVRGTAI